MSVRTTQKLGSAKYKKTSTATNQLNSLAYVLIGLLFSVFLVLSVMNDYLFFDWLAMGSFIVFALIGFHFIGQKQIKRN